MSQKMVALVLIASLLVITGCGGSMAAPAPAAKSQSQVVVFYGDSLTARFPLAQFFPGQPYKNDGTEGLTAVTLNSAFQSSVFSSSPHAVVILAGTNDLWQGDTSAHVVQTLTNMYSQSAADGLPFVICTIPPMRGANSFHNADILNVNIQLKSYAAAHAVPLADYYSALVDPLTGDLRDDLANVLSDGTLDVVHINSAGYAAIAPLARGAIAKIH